MIEVAFQRAWDKGYIRKSITARAGGQFWSLAEQAITLSLADLKQVFCGPVMAAFAAGSSAPMLANALAAGALPILGLAFLSEYATDHLSACGPLLLSACDLTVNQCPACEGDILELTLDMAARLIAEAVGAFWKSILLALVIWTGMRLPNLKELETTRLNADAPDLIGWLVPRLTELRMQLRTLSVIEGGQPSGAVTPMQGAIRVARNTIPQLVSPDTNQIIVGSLEELDQILLNQGFQLVSAQPYPPESPGYQLFYRKGNVLVRFKTHGDGQGPRAGTPHVLFSYNDGLGLDWQNDLGKFTATARVEAKIITDPARFQHTDFQGNPQRFVLLPTDFQIEDVDSWAGRTHFNAPPGFSFAGLERILVSVLTAELLDKYRGQSGQSE